MKIITISDILKICGGILVVGDENTECNNFSKDTRTLNIGDVYVGIKGEKFDGNLLYSEALDKGASVCILQGVNISEEEKIKYQNKAIIIVDDTIKAIGKLASYKRSFYDIPVVAVTGSVGKTSTKDIIASVVEQKYKVLKTQGNFNNHIGLPLTILGLKDHQALVIEMGMNHFNEISYLTNIAKPTVAVITNIGTSHIGNLGSRENILKAKLEILEGLSKDGLVILNNDNDLLQRWNTQNKAYQTITYGIEEQSDLVANNIKIQEQNSSYQIQYQSNIYEVQVPVSGQHFVYNSLAAIGVGKALKMDMTSILNGIKKFKLTKKRMDIEKIREDITVINDSYNASYDSMKSALEYLHDIKANRKIAVLGDMLELGDYSSILHKKVGEEVVKNNIDLLITVGKCAQDIAKQAQEDGMKKECIYPLKTNEQASNLLNEIIKTDDVILLKASNALNFTQILNELKQGGNIC